MGSDVFIEVKGLKQQFGEHQVLRGVDAVIRRAETVVLLGASGGGKSVLIKHFNGLLKPVAGSVKVEGIELNCLGERELNVSRRKIGMMFQNGALFDSFTVFENIAFPLREMGEKDEAVIEQKVQEALDIVQLSNHGQKMPSELSGGMRKRVALARAVVHRPECVLYDEPHAGLDPITADQIDHLMKDLQAKWKITNVVITHEIRSAFRIADRILFLKEGLLYWEGSVTELKASKDPILSDFIAGNSSRSWESRSA